MTHEERNSWVEYRLTNGTISYRVSEVEQLLIKHSWQTRMNREFDVCFVSASLLERNLSLSFLRFALRHLQSFALDAVHQLRPELEAVNVHDEAIRSMVESFPLLENILILSLALLRSM
jgi:hypothetical protein